MGGRGGNGQAGEATGKRGDDITTTTIISYLMRLGGKE